MGPQVIEISLEGLNKGPRWGIKLLVVLEAYPRQLRRIWSAGIKPRRARLIIKTDDETVVLGRAGGAFPAFQASRQGKLHEFCRTLGVSACAIFLIERVQGLISGKFEEMLLRSEAQTVVE